MDIASVQKRIAQLEQFQQEAKAAKEMIKAELESDPSYLESAEEVKAAADKKKRIKEEIQAREANQRLINEIKENNEEIKTLKEILSAELIQVYEEKKTDEIEDINGETRKFKLTVKLLPKGAHYENRDISGQYAKEL